MFDFPILNIFITLAFTYFLLSVIASSVNEILSSFSKIRGKMLWEAMEHWIDDTDWNKLWNEKLSKSAFITSLRKDGDGTKTEGASTEENKDLIKEKFPSYIPSDNFVQAVLGLFRDGNQPLTIEGIRAKLLDPKGEQVGGSKTREWLLALLDKAENEADEAKAKMKALEKNIAMSFDHSMERVTGWYKKKTKKILLVISLVIAAALNIDTVEIAAELWKKPELASQAADAVSQMLPQVQQDSLDPAKFNLSFADDSSVTKYVVATKKFVRPGKVDGTDTSVIALDTIFSITEREAAHIGQAKTALSAMNIPMGWLKENYPSCEGKSIARCVGEWLLKILGILLTAAALTLGAPFWFELVNKLVNLRAAGSRPMTYQESEHKKMRAQAGKK